MPDGIILRAGRSSLGVNIRSRLGVKTRPSNIVYRIIVATSMGFSTDSEGNYQEPQDSADLYDNVIARFEQLVNELKDQGKKAELVADDRWIWRQGRELESYSGVSEVINLVFLLGYNNPVKQGSGHLGGGEYFGNYVYAEGDSLPVYDGDEFPGYVESRSTFDTGTLTYGDPTVSTIEAVSTRTNCHQRSFGFRTYSFEEWDGTLDRFIANSRINSDRSLYDGEGDRFRSSKVFVFHAPWYLPEAVEDKIYHREEFHVGETVIEFPGNLYLTPAGNYEFNPVTIIPGSTFLGNFPRTITGSARTNILYICSPQSPDNGVKYEWHVLQTEKVGGPKVTVGDYSLNESEGADQSEDWTDRSGPVIQAFIEDYSPEEEDFQWRYSGRVDHKNLVASEIISAVT